VIKDLAMMLHFDLDLAKLVFERNQLQMPEHPPGRELPRRTLLVYKDSPSTPAKLQEVPTCTSDSRRGLFSLDMAAYFANGARKSPSRPIMSDSWAKNFVNPIATSITT
jgi:hypothetical protein